MLWFLRIRRLFRTTGREALILWYAFRNPATPGAIKLGSVLLLAYLLSPIDLLPDELLLYLMPSRYCETDKLTDIAWSLFVRFLDRLLRCKPPTLEIMPHRPDRHRNMALLLD